MSIGRWRSSMVLLGICIVAVLIGAVRLATQQQPPQTGSSASAAPDGALAAYTWFADVGGQPRRLTSRAIDPDVTSFIIVQPSTLPNAAAIQALNRLADRGGTIVLAGDSLEWLATARSLSVVADPASPAPRTLTPDGLDVPIRPRFRLRAEGAQPLLVTDDGQLVGLRRAYRQGTLIVIASATPLTNAGLRDDATARFVYRAVVAPLQGQSVAFDEYQRVADATTSAPATLNQLLFQTSAGAAILYAGLLTFAYLFLTGRRLGPALALRSAADSQRTMYEHVQMLANLYRRAGQLNVVRETFSRHYSRLRPRDALNGRDAARRAEALVRVQNARSEADLISAVADLDDAG
jgi:uncharacterized protein DUF4350